MPAAATPCTPGQRPGYPRLASLPAAPYITGKKVVNTLSPEIISLLGVIIGLAVLIILAFRGFNVIVASVIAAVAVALFSGQEMLPLIADAYMTRFASFAKSNFLIFMLSAVFGKLMGDSGAADTIAYSLLRVLDLIHSPKVKQLVGGLTSSLIVAILTYSSVSLLWLSSR